VPRAVNVHGQADGAGVHGVHRKRIGAVGVSVHDPPVAGVADDRARTLECNAFQRRACQGSLPLRRLAGRKQRPHGEHGVGVRTRNTVEAPLLRDTDRNHHLKGLQREVERGPEGPVLVVGLCRGLKHHVRERLGVGHGR
jgi:hypothetical protein